MGEGERKKEERLEAEIDWKKTLLQCCEGGGREGLEA